MSLLIPAIVLSCFNLAFEYQTQFNFVTLEWRHNEHDSVSDHQPHDCLLNRLFRHWSKKTSKLRVTSLCAGNSPGTGEFPAQKASNAENVSIWWRHHDSCWSEPIRQCEVYSRPYGNYRPVWLAGGDFLGSTWWCFQSFRSTLFANNWMVTHWYLTNNFLTVFCWKYMHI